MSVRRSRSWASVVANGIDEPMQIQKVMPSEAVKSVPPPPIGSPKLPSELSSKIPSTLSDGSMKSTDKTMDVDSLPCVKVSEETTGFNSKFYFQSKSNFQRPFRKNWPRNTPPFPDHRHHPRSNNQGVFYRPCRAHYSTTHFHQRYSGPHPRFSRSSRFIAPKFYSKMSQLPTPLNREVNEPGQSMDQANEWEQPSFTSSLNDGSKESTSQEQSTYDSIDLDQSNDEDSYENHRVCLSPLGHRRCQITFSDAAANSIQWEPISKSRRVWEPLDMRQRGLQDPSKPMRK